MSCSENTNSCGNKSSKCQSKAQCIVTLLGLAFGIWLLFLGLSKWFLFGPSGFIGYVSGEFQNVTWLPSFLLLATSWIILIAEPLLGAMLVFSRGRCKYTWLGAAGLMYLLLMGKTITSDHATVANIWQYFILTIVGAALACCSSSCSSDSNCCSTDKTDCKEDKGQNSCCSTSQTEKTSCCSGN